ncbi:wings apart-like protein regulation of heterochromatin-domain-containing protein [Aspergillus pseudoustus]|uniref:Wings apart-like protein regulation of heterochromatin-domain-containing protein n=1 Tax=Aspergillus pseudoustus TaxID=1810923 RepID=A0ABR4K819_9EURO
MSQNRKRPVTYGKSSLNRARAGVGLYMPDTDASLTPPRLRTLSDGPAATPTSPSTPFVQPARPSFAKNLAGSSLNQGGNARSVMQRKRRKLPPEEAHNTDDQVKPDLPAGVNPSVPEIRDEDDLLSIGRGHDQKSTDVSLSLRSDAQLKIESPKRAPPSARRQKCTSPPPAHEDKSRLGFLDAQTATDPASPRKRLIDSLGLTDGPHQGLTTGSDDAPEVSVHEGFPEGDFSASARQPSSKNNTKSQSRTFERSHTTPTNSMSSMLRSSRVTYSRQRSFLNDLIGATGDNSQGAGNGSKLQPKKPEAHASFASRIPLEEEDGHDNNKAVRSIHELRQAGHNVRFREIVDSIFEDIEDQYNSISGICCSIADLCGKLRDPQFAHRFSEQGFDERLVDCITISSNIVWTSLVFSAFQLIIAGGQASRVFAELLWAKILDHSPVLLEIEDDLLALARDPSQGLSKTAQAAVKGIISPSLSGMAMVRLSPRSLALECIKSTLCLLRETGHTVRLAPTALLDKLLDLLATGVSANREPIDNLTVLSPLFSILENYSIVTGPFDDYHCQSLRRLSQFHDLFALTLRDQTRQILLSYVRVILNLTNKEPALCDSFALSELVSGLVRVVVREFSDVSKHFGPTENDSLNAVILALGTLINLTEETEKARAMLVHSNDCAVSPLQQLLEQFFCCASSIDQAHSVLEVHENVVAGYLSILLLTICQNTEALLFVKNSRGLAMIFSTAEKFMQYHREVEKETGVETCEGESRLTKRLEHIIGQARRLEGVSDELR